MPKISQYISSCIGCPGYKQSIDNNYYRQSAFIQNITNIITRHSIAWLNKQNSVGNNLKRT